MKPVDQIRTGRGRGQCAEATFASLLGVRLDDVPDLWAGPGVPEDAPPLVHHPPELREKLYAWLKEQHQRMCVVMPCEGWLIPDAYAAAVERMWRPNDDPPPKWMRYHRAIGPNPDGVLHAVVCHAGVVVHDPNPTRRGITHAIRLDWLVPLAYIPAEEHGHSALQLHIRRRS